MNVADIISAYSKGGNSAASTGTDAGSVGATGGGSFSDTLKNAISDSIDTLKTGEKAATSAALGKESLATAVTAIANAESTLTLVAGIRDKIIAAYQEISRTTV